MEFFHFAHRDWSTSDENRIHKESAIHYVHKYFVIWLRTCLGFARTDNLGDSSHCQQQYNNLERLQFFLKDEIGEDNGDKRAHVIYDGY